MVIEFTAI